ncbi:cell division protein ZapA [Vulcaniibacterium gelatinicum]|uniref:cell division protein ZapA n=1 Tax=Vulcaniibacterium gelatinicum TaxID=2598725 RepID=UPI0011CB7331|nr:cell division protein ZapA [Vulcaniibacterium gelatinicum]
MSEPVSVRILDREYTVGCEPDERDGLMAAAKLLDARMRELRGNNRMVALDRLAVLAALNLAHELLQLRDDTARRERELGRAIDDAQRRIDDLFAAAGQR